MLNAPRNLTPDYIPDHKTDPISGILRLRRSMKTNNKIAINVKHGFNGQNNSINYHRQSRISAHSSTSTN